MSARLLLTVAHTMLVESHGEEAVYDMLHPPTAEEKRAAHIEQLRVLGVPFEAV